MRRKSKAVAPQVRISTESEITAWLVARIAQFLVTSPDTIDTGRPFADFGLDSVQIAGLSGDLEGALGRPISETAPWEYPTIALISAFLSGREMESRGAQAPAWDTGEW